MEKHEARWWKAAEDGAAGCFLCPRRCHIKDGAAGFCGVRRNEGGRLLTIAYGYPVAMHVDPIGKKPLANFLPGTKTFSLGTFGCNLDCCFCQNHELSRGFYNSGNHQYFSPETIVALARRHDCASVAFTYNEPTIFGEYVCDVARLAHEDGLSTVLVSNGYITLEAAADIYPCIDAANIDMKGFSEKFYTEMTSSHLQPVLESMKYFHRIGGHLEISNLIIPGKNDSEEMIKAFLAWVMDELSPDVPLHFSAYHPDHRYHESPPTSVDSLLRIRDAALGRGVRNVYLGNVVIR